MIKIKCGDPDAGDLCFDACDSMIHLDSMMLASCDARIMDAVVVVARCRFWICSVSRVGCDVTLTNSGWSGPDTRSELPVANVEAGRRRSNGKSTESTELRRCDFLRSYRYRTGNSLSVLHASFTLLLYFKTASRIKAQPKPFDREVFIQDAINNAIR
jgi:hypothetical protein